MPPPILTSGETAHSILDFIHFEHELKTVRAKKGVLADEKGVYLSRWAGAALTSQNIT